MPQSGPTLAAALDALWRVAAPSLPAPVDFATLKRRLTPNDALASPPDLCPKARPDLVPPVFDLPAARLRAVVAEIARAEPGTEALPSEGEQDRYLVRTRHLRFPDLVDVRVLPRGEGRSTLALYSRSRIGLGDFGVNRARLARWLQRIAERVGP